MTDSGRIRIENKSPLGLTTDDLIEAIRKNDSPGICWIMHPSTLIFIRTLSDDKGNPVLHINEGYNFCETKILGRRVITDHSMIPIESARPGDTFIILGDEYAKN